MEKNVLDRRLKQLSEEGIVFVENANIGVEIPITKLQKEYDAILLAGGATQSRDLPVPGREHEGVHLAMDFLSRQNRICEGEDPSESFLSAHGKDVIIIGGGDTGADCLGTASRTPFVV